MVFFFRIATGDGRYDVDSVSFSKCDMLIECPWRVIMAGEIVLLCIIAMGVRYDSTGVIAAKIAWLIVSVSYIFGNMSPDSGVCARVKLNRYMLVA